MDLDLFYKTARENRKIHAKFLTNLKKRKLKLDEITEKIHHQESEKIDCLSCGNCCKTTNPLIIKSDIKRLAKYFKMKEVDFESQYLKIDEDGDRVFKTIPCVFLEENNECSIYDIRPNACQEFPHTDRKKLFQITDVIAKNNLICPISHNFTEKLMEEMNYKKT